MEYLGAMHIATSFTTTLSHQARRSYEESSPRAHRHNSSPQPPLRVPGATHRSHSMPRASTRRSHKRSRSAAPATTMPRTSKSKKSKSKRHFPGALSLTRGHRSSSSSSSSPSSSPKAKSFSIVRFRSKSRAAPAEPTTPYSPALALPCQKTLASLRARQKAKKSMPCTPDAFRRLCSLSTINEVAEESF